MSRVMMSKRRTLGIDPGLARLGWALIESHGSTTTLVGCGCLETAAGIPSAQRLLQLHRRLGAIIEQYHPSQLAIEKLFFSRNVSTGISVGQARGIVLLAAAEHQLPTQEFTPTAVKLAVTGDGRADKRQMGRMIQILLKLDRLPKHDDTTDAMAIAFCASAMKVVH